MNRLVKIFADIVSFVSIFLFFVMPVWILVSSFFTFMALLFLVPLYVPIWIVLRIVCRALIKSPVMDERRILRLERAVRYNTRALKYNLYLSIPVLFLFFGYLHGLGKI